MQLNDFLGPDPIIVDLKAEDRWAAIDELIGHLVAHQKIKRENWDAIVADVKKRESSISTGVGYGIAIPHAVTDLVPEIVGIMGRSRTGIGFDALNNKPVKKVMLFLVPPGQFQKYLATLTSIAKLVHRKDFHDEDL